MCVTARRHKREIKQKQKPSKKKKDNKKVIHILLQSISPPNKNLPENTPLKTMVRMDIHLKRTPPPRNLPPETLGFPLFLFSPWELVVRQGLIIHLRMTVGTLGARSLLAYTVRTSTRPFISHRV